MSNQEPQASPRPSPFYCYAVGIAPEVGQHRVLLARFEELRSRSRWLVRLRWLAAAGLVMAALVGRYMLDLPVSAPVLYSVAAFLLVYNAGWYLLTRSEGTGADIERGMRRASVLAALQIVIDLLALTVLLHSSGGVENPFFFYFVFHMVIASILLTRRSSFLIATLAIGLFYSLVLLEYFGVLSHHALWPGELGLYRDMPYVTAVLVVFATTMYLSVYFAGDIVEKLRLRDTELITVTSSLEKGSLDLVEAYEKIRALEAKKSEFLRTTAHQLRSPLSAIRSLLDVVLDGFAGDLERQRDMIQRAHDRTDMMLAMVNDMLSLSALKDAEDVARGRSQRVNVCEIVAELDAFYRPRASEKGLDLETRPPVAACEITADTDDIRQALNNLLDNAINYTPAGGAVRISAEASGGRLTIRISDTGIGIPEESIPRLFEEFYRAPNAKKTIAHGTGLGLAIVKRSVERASGTVSVESRPGEGTTFTLRFPLA